jgi:antitoxin HicB
MGELRYAVVLEPYAASEGGGFTVTVPALPEIVTQGEHLEDALFVARDAIELSLAVRRDEGDEIPLSDAEYARLEIVAVSSSRVVPLPKLLRISARQPTRVLRRAEFILVRQTGSNAFFRHSDGRMVKLPMHTGDLKNVDTRRDIEGRRPYGG